MKKLIKGISPVVATVLLIIISVGLAALLYAWATGWFGTTTQGTSQAPKASIMIDTVSYDSTTGQVTVYVRNIGTVTINISAVYIKDINGKVVGQTFPTTNNQIAPGDVVSVAVSTGQLSSGSYVALAVASDGSEATYTFVVP